MEIKTFTSALALCILLSNTTVFAGEGEENEKEHKGTQVKSRFFKANDQIRIGSVTLTHTGRPQKVKEKDGKVTVTTDNNDSASYQLVSQRRSVIVGEEIEVPYEIVVEEGGWMSLGLLNTTRSRWYPSQSKGESAELILGPGTYKGIYKRTVPEKETETSLVIRNYHLPSNGGPGQSTFTLVDLGFKTRIIPILSHESINFEGIELKHTGNPEKVEKKEGIVTVTTDNNALASYQLRSDWVSVNPGDSLEVTYKVTLQPNSKMSFGFLNTKGRGWYPSVGEKEELLLTTGKEEKTYGGTYLRIVPSGEEKTAFVVRNYHLVSNGGAGQSTFTIEKLGFKKEIPSEITTINTMTGAEEEDLLTKSLIDLKENNPEEYKALEQAAQKNTGEVPEELQETVQKVTGSTSYWTWGGVAKTILTLGLNKLFQ